MDFTGMSWRWLSQSIRRKKVRQNNWPDSWRGRWSRRHQSSPEQSGLPLPEDFEGRQLRFRKETGTEYLLFPVLGVILAVFFHWQARNTEIEARKKREKQLQYDYADLVYQLMVFTGAGLTVSRAWKQIVNNYEKRLEHENSQQRAVYEEMEIALGRWKMGFRRARQSVVLGNDVSTMNTGACLRFLDKAGRPE